MILGAVWEVHLLVAAGDKVPSASALIDELAVAYPAGKQFSPDFDTVIANVLVSGARQKVFGTTRAG